MLRPWPHQEKALERVLTAIGQGSRRICLCSPPGTGKTVMAGMIIKNFLDRGRKVSFYTNRRMLLEQSAKNFAGFELEHGIRAAGYEYEPWKPFQISSIQTETARIPKPEKYRGWSIHPADIAIVDEAHLNAGPQMRDILTKHVELGGVVLGLTATPIDLGQVYDKLILACTLKEGRECGALVPIRVFGPDEPDLSVIRQRAKHYGEDLSGPDQQRIMKSPTLFGRVWEWWNRLNPEHFPTIGFAPGVEESMWFAREFWQKGIPSAHIDGAEVWVNGERHYTSQDMRDEILRQHKAGKIKVIWNRFVLREGIDMPWAMCGILATVFGSTQSYLQAISRLGRATPGKRLAIAIDHGGNWHRHGSPNEERHWDLEYTNAIIAGLREEYLRANPEKIPVRCPQCAGIMGGRVCPCGFEAKNKRYPRPVVQADGTLKMMSENLFRKRAIDQRPGAEKNWEKVYWSTVKSKNPAVLRKSFKEIIGWYQTQNDWQYPNPNWKFMPVEPVDLFRRVIDVPMHRLRGCNG